MKADTLVRTTGLALALPIALVGQAALAGGTDIIQEGTNAAAVTVNTAITGVGNLGMAAGTSISATGAVASVGLSGVNADFNRNTIGVGLLQMNSTNSGAASVTGSIGFSTTATTVGEAGAVSIGVSGATTAMSMRGIGLVGFSMPTMDGAGNQDATNSAAVTGTGTITATAIDLAGDAASMSVSAVGATSSFALSGVGASSFGGATFGDNTTTAVQTVTNDGTAADVLNTGSSISLAGMSGDATSVGILSKGAAASVSMSTIGTAAAAGMDVGALTQTVNNATTSGHSGTVEVVGGDITIANDMLGVSSSASISAMGASASYSLASVSDTAYTVREITPTVANAAIPLTQTVTNGALGTVNIGNTNSIDLGGAAMGVNASASISGVGAGSTVSFSALSPL